jgi:hypothetical protein
MDSVGLPVPSLTAVEVSPPAGATTQLSYSGTPRLSDGTTRPDDYVAELLDPVRRMMTFEEMRSSDDAVHTAIDARRQEINAANWVLASEDDSDLGTQILDFCEDNIYPHLDDLLRLLGGGALQYGFGAVEPVFAWADESPASAIARETVARASKAFIGRHIVLRKIAHLRQRTVHTFRITETGDLTAVEQYVFNGSSFLRRLVPAEKLLIWTYDKQGDDFWGVPPTRHCYKAWSFKTQIERLNVLGLDRFGVGTPVIEAGENWTELERKQAFGFARAWRAGEDSALLHPFGGSISIVSGDGRMMMSALEWVKYYNLAIAKTFLTQQTELGSTATGARALGETFLQQMGGLVQADCEELAALINEQLIKPLVVWNFGPQESYPLFTPSERVTYGGGVGQVINQLVACGALHPRPEDEAFFRDALNLPPVAIKDLQDEAEARTAATDALNAAKAAAPVADPNAPPPADKPAPKPPAQFSALLKDATAPAFAMGDRVEALVNHMPGMKGTTGVVAIANAGSPPYYGIRFDGDTTTHKWLTEDEIKAAPAKKDGGAGGGMRGMSSADPIAPRLLALVDGGPPAATPGTSYRTPEFQQWEQGILRPDVVVRDLNLATSRLAGEVQDVLAAIDDDLERQATDLAGLGAAALSGGVRDIAVPDRLRKKLRAVLYEAAQRSRDYGAKAVRNEVLRQIAPDGIGPQRDGWLTPTEAPSFYARIVSRLRSLVAGESDVTPKDLHLAAEVDRAVEEEISRRESATRSSILTALAQAAGAVGAVLAGIASTAAKSALIGLSTGRTEANVQGVVNVGFGIGRSDAADAIVADAAPSTSGGGGGSKSGIVDSDGVPVDLVGKVYSAVMDGGTCPECAKWDGAEFPIDYPEDYTGVQAPNPRCAGGYSRCRCVWIYITSRESVPLIPSSKGPMMAGA